MGDIILEPKTDHILDLRTFIKPFSLLKVTQVFRAAKREEVIEIIMEDLKIKNDLFKILPVSHYQLIDIKEEKSICRIFFMKT